MSIITQGYAKNGGIMLQGYNIADEAIYPPASAVASGVIYGPNGSLQGTMTYGGFVDTNPKPRPPRCHRRSTPGLTLTKRLADNRLYDLDCTDLLDDAEVILYVLGFTSDTGDIGFGPSFINPAPVYYARLDNWADTGKVVQVRIAAGLLGYGVDEQCCNCRMLVVTNENPQLEVPFTLHLSNGSPP